MKPKLLLLLVIMLAATMSNAEVDRSTPESTIKSLASAVEQGNLEDALSCVKESKKSAMLEAIFSQIKTMGFKVTATVSDVKISDNLATAQVSATISGKTNGGPKEMKTTDAASLEKVGGNWLLVNKASENPKNSFINSMTFLFTHGAEPLQVSKDPSIDPKDDKTLCLGNIKQLGLGLMILAADFDDVIKVKADAWKKSLMPYVKNETIFHCPLDKSGTVSYSINPLVVGKSLISIERIAETVLFYEGAKGQLVFRHKGMAAVVFCDGHAKWVSPQEAKKLIWKP